MYTTGALFAPSYDLRSCTADGVEVGATITVTCDDNDLGLQIGAPNTTYWYRNCRL